MNATAPRALAALPAGTFRGCAGGRRWLVTKQAVAGGRGWKLVAEELGGGDYISVNGYRLGAGIRLFPCEMSRAKVERFLQDLVVDRGPDGPAGAER